jgi:protein ImuB
LLAICCELLDAHERFLVARQLGTRELEFSFYHLKAPATTASVGCTQATRHAAHWFELLRMRFERLVLPEPVIAVRLAGGRTEAIRPESERLGFAGEVAASGRHSMTQLAERLAARMGRQAIKGVMTVAEHRPQRAFRLDDPLAGGSSGPRTVTEGRVRRPLWMLPEPEPLPAVEGFPIHEGRLEIIDGPERIETGWWDGEGIARDYYTAVNPRGLRLWIFRDRSPGAPWYLHGYFG